MADSQQKTALYTSSTCHLPKQFAPKETAVLHRKKLLLAMQWDGKGVAARIKLRLQRHLLSNSH